VPISVPKMPGHCQSSVTLCPDLQSDQQPKGKEVACMSPRSTCARTAEIARMNIAFELREKADRYRLLARQMTDPQAVRALTELAADTMRR
jgi:hypothetical protein